MGRRASQPGSDSKRRNESRRLTKPPSCAQNVCTCTAKLRTKILDFGGFDSSRI